jgi:hypothetical protein
MEFDRLRAGRCTPVLAAVLLAAGLTGCMLPSRGEPVFVDHRAGRFWSGKGMLVEASEDRSRCRVAVRGREGLVEKRWVDCTHVHPR